LKPVDRDAVRGGRRGRSRKRVDRFLGFSECFGSSGVTRENLNALVDRAADLIRIAVDCELLGSDEIERWSLNISLFPLKLFSSI